MSADPVRRTLAAHTRLLAMLLLATVLVVAQGSTAAELAVDPTRAVSGTFGP